MNVFNKEIGEFSKSNNKYSWTNYHTTINYQGQKIDVKAPTKIGNRWIRKFRPRIEKWFNDSFIVPESIEASVKREAKTYSILNNIEFSTFESMQHLISDNKTFNRLLLTKKVENKKHLIDLINEEYSSEEKLNHIKSATRLLKKLHDLNYTSGDAWLGNYLVNTDNNKLMIYDFGFKVNPSFRDYQAKLKDLISLTLSAIYRSNVDYKQVIETIVDAYVPEKQIVKEAETSMAKLINKPPKKVGMFFREKVYSMPLFMITSEEEMNYKTELFKQLEKYDFKNDNDPNKSINIKDQYKTGQAWGLNGHPCLDLGINLL